MVVMIIGIDLSQEIFAVDVLRIFKTSLKHRRKHVLRSLQLYGDQAFKSYLVGGANDRPYPPSAYGCKLSSIHQRIFVDSI